MASGNEQLISEYVDRTGFASDTKFVLEQLNTIFEAYKRLSEIKIGLGNVQGLASIAPLAKEAQAEIDKISKATTRLDESFAKNTQAIKLESASMKELADQAAKNEIAQKALAKSKKEVEAAFKSGNISAEEYNRQLAGIIEQQTALKVSGQQIQQALKNIEKESQAAEGSLNELRAQLNLALQKFDALSAADKGTEVGTELQARIQELTKTISEQEQATGRFQRNVGNYQGSAKIIVEALGDVAKKIEELKVKQQGLQDLSKKDPIGFKLSGQNDLDQTNAQLKTLETQFNALNNITSNPQFLNIAGKVGDTNKELRFFQQRLNELEDAGLKNSQVYKDVQQRLAKLTDQIADTKAEVKALASDSRSFDLFAGSINFAADAFQTFAGFAALAGESEEDVARITKTLIAIQSVANGVKGIANELTTKGTAANKAYAFVQKQVEVLTSASASATQKWSAALKTVGIGLLIAGIVKLIDYLDIFGSETKEAVDITDRLTQAFEDQKKAIDDVNNALDFQGKLRAEKLKQQGATEQQLFENELATRKDQLELLKEEEKKAFDERGKAQELYLTLYSIKNGKFSKDELEQVKKYGDAIQKNVNDRTAAVAQKENEIQLLIEQNNTRRLEDANAQGKRQLEIVRKQIEEEKKAALELFKFRQGLIIEENKPIAENDFFSEKNRIEAAKKIADAEKAIFIAQADFELQQTGLTVSKILAIRQKLSDAKSDQERQTIEKELALTNAQILLFERAANSQVKIQQDLLQSITSIQLKARANFKSDIEANKALLNEQAAELEARETQRIQKSIDNEKRLLDERLSVIQISTDRELTLLNEQYSKGKIGKEKYEQEKKRIEAKAIQDSLLAQIDYYEKLLKIQEATGIDTTESVKQIAALKKAISELNIKDDPTKSFRENLEEFLGYLQNYASQIGSVISDAFNASATAQKNRIQEEIDLLDERTAKEIEAINQTTANKEEAENKIAIAEARRAAQKRVLEQRQRQIDQQKAQFDKANTIAQIVINTALAVVKALPNVGLAILAGAIGAAQLAVAIATPIPKFREGKNLDKQSNLDSYEGPAYVGDGGRSELIERADGRMEITPNRPTITWVGKDDIIHPDADVALKSTFRTTDKVLASNVTVTPMIDFDPVTTGLKRMEKSIVSTIKNKTENHFHYDSPMKSYLKKTGDSWTRNLSNY